MVSRNPPRKESPQSPSGTGRDETSPSGGRPGGWAEALQDAAAAYIATIARISTGLQEKHQAALDEHVRAIYSAAEDLSNIYRDFAATYASQDWEKLKSVQADWMSRVQAYYGQASRDAGAGTYPEAVRTAWLTSKPLLPAAFQDYLAAIKRGVANMPEETADPASVAVIAHGIAAVASYAHTLSQVAGMEPPSLKE